MVLDGDGEILAVREAISGGEEALATEPGTSVLSGAVLMGSAIHVDPLRTLLAGECDLQQEPAPDDGGLSSPDDTLSVPDTFLRTSMVADRRDLGPSMMNPATGRRLHGDQTERHLSLKDRSAEGRSIVLLIAED